MEFPVLNTSVVTYAVTWGENEIYMVYHGETGSSFKGFIYP